MPDSLPINRLLRDHFVWPLPDRCRIYNLPGSAAALLLALQSRPYIAVEADEQKALALRKDIAFYQSIVGSRRILFLPEESGAEAAGLRAELFATITDDDPIVTSSANLASTFWNAPALSEKTIHVKSGLVGSRQKFEESLISLGYRKVPMVTVRGEYSLRGWILDIFPSTAEDPVRVEFFGDEIDYARCFDVDNQRSKGDIDDFVIFPAREPEKQQRLADLFSDRIFYCLDPLAEPELLPAKAVMLSRYAFRGSGTGGPFTEAGGSGSAEDVAADSSGPAPWDDSDIETIPETEEDLPEIDAGLLLLKGAGVLPEERRELADLGLGIAAISREHRVLIVASSKGQSERIIDILREADLIAPAINMAEVAEYEGPLAVVVGELSAGIFLQGLLVLTEKELFGERPVHRPMKRSKLTNLLISIDDIAPGDYIVHREYGVGRFTGITRQMTEDTEIELMQIDYDGGRIYIPVQNIQNISKFRVEEGVVPKVDKLSGKTWQRKKERARKKAHDIAERLVALYAGRQTARGYSFSADTELHREFDSFFAYEETPDQLKAISEIKRDMESDKPMDRLLCGDVGYGKTEVAMRAVFKSVFDHRQVAVLVPTTILAEQHYRTFCERFSGFPVSIDTISRFRTRKEINDVLKRLSQGQIDIVIGTHGLLSKNIVFSRPGLLVVDEEHKFGVGQKERIKEMSRSIDVLNLTATPIPRTLHMALSGIRDISVIETPPEERLAVRSVVSVFDDKLIRDAITHELNRSGQVFFVHNRISDIFRIADHLQQLVPNARIGIAHGQMPEKELESVMHRFFSGQVNLLVSTAIVGSGLDIPSANTIIINRADKMGLADLYQLRGRVGRSSVKGYACFLAPPESLLTEEARKRLQAVQEMSYLGAGFRLAMKDLEIRGSGDIFGAEQSGHIHEVGFDLYIEMLEQAVAEAKGLEIKETFEPAIDLKVSALIPADYIEDISLRLSFYRRIASLLSEEEVTACSNELQDRFGKPPDEVANLLKIMQLKILARELFILKLAEINGKVKVVFSPDTPVQPDDIFGLQHTRKGLMKFLPDGFELTLKMIGFEQVFVTLHELLQELRVSCVRTAAD
ncbi:MAG: transcription-repair coupling factor [Thermodesulfovibrio sp.]|nr:transcription-repair coupling factor [Thermodesulfovibrio sp.]